MKLKLILTLLVTFMVGSYAECIKSDYIKYIDIGLSKNQIKSICDINTNNKKTQWITISKSKCVTDKGKVKKGVCNADWDTAKSICSGVGGRLPTIAELQKVVVDCKGIISGDNNIDNTSYQYCYKSKGFISYNYWSSSINTSNISNAWPINFYDAYIGSSDKRYSLYVRCVKVGQ